MLPLSATHVRLPWVLVERLDGEWLVAMCRDATCVSNERVLVESSVFTGDDVLS